MRLAARLIFVVSLVCAVIAWPLSHTFAADSAPQEVVNAAQSGLPNFLRKIPSGMEAAYGLKSGDTLDTAVVGEPFRLSLIEPAMLARADAKASVDSISRVSTQWFFPVIVGGEARCLLVVDRMEDGWQAVSLGYAALARELTAMSAQWSVANGYTPRLFASLQAGRYFFHVPQVGATNLTQIVQSQHFGTEILSSRTGGRYETLSTAGDVASDLREALREH